MIEAIIEYLPIQQSESAGRASWELFSTEDEDGKQSHYLNEIKILMKEKSGIYIFYDSLARAIYVGKAERQSLWKEANLAYNRRRGGHQTMWMVQHPERNVNRVIRDRKITETAVELCLIASYFSAYAVAEDQISNMEAFLIRAFANNLMNKRIETFRLREKE